MAGRSPLFQVTFDDFDAYVEAIEDVNHVRCTMPRFDRPEWTLRRVRLPADIHIQVAAEGGGHIAQGVTPPTRFNLFVHCNGMIRGNGKNMPLGSALLMPPGSEFYFASGKAHEWCAISLPIGLAQRTGLLMTDMHSANPQARLIRGLETPRKKLWQRVTRFITDAAATREIALHPNTLRGFQQALLDDLQRAYGRQSVPDRNSRGRPALVDRRLISLVLELIGSKPDARVSMQELERETGVSARAIHYGFKKYLGVSPMRFMHLRRLQKARQALSNQPADAVTVTQVATDLGIWDLGRFAKSYREVFGELPSITLRRNRNRGI